MTITDEAETQNEDYWCPFYFVAELDGDELGYC